MDKRSNDIEKLFSKKFENFEVKSSEEEWLNLSSKLSKSNFLKFSFVTFNIYYLLVLIAFAGSVTFTGIRNIQLTNEVYKLEQTVKTYQASGQDKSTIYQPVDSTKVTQPLVEAPPKKDVIQAENGSSKKNRTTKENIIEPFKPISDPKDKVSIEEKEIKDTVQAPIPKIAQTDTTTRNKVRKVKKTFVVKSKTVVIKDTVVVTKSFKQK